MLVFLGCMIIIATFGILLQFTDMRLSKKRKERVFLFFVGILLIFIYTFRNNMMTDTENYAFRFHMFNSTHSFWPPTWLGWKEPLDVLCNLMVGSITSNAIFMQLFYGLFIIGISFWFIRKYSYNIYLSVLLYYMCGYYFDAMNVVRNVFVASLYLVCIYLIEKEKYIFSIVGIIILGLIHRTSFLFMPLLFLFPIIKERGGLRQVVKGGILCLLPIAYLFLEYSSLGLSFDPVDSFSVANINRVLIYLLFSIGNFVLEKYAIDETEIEKYFEIYNILLFVFACLTVRYKLCIRFCYYVSMPSQILFVNRIKYIREKRIFFCLCVFFSIMYMFLYINGSVLENYHLQFKL